MRTAAVIVCIVLSIVAGGCGTDIRKDGSPGGTAGPKPRFYEDIAPLVYKNCTSCHQDGGVGPFPLVTYDDVVAMGDQIPNAIMTRQMPPWGADNSGECNTYKDARWLSDDEIALFVEWINGDREAGDPANAPELPAQQVGLDKVSTTAAMTDAYSPDPTLHDDYRCFIIDAGITSNTYLTGFEVRPGTPEIVHHILMFQLDSAQAESQAAALDANNAGPGYTCFGAAGAPATLLGVWAPGTRVASYPAGTGLQVKANRKIVLQVHYHRQPGTPADRTEVDFRLESTVAHPSFLYLLAAPDLQLPPRQMAATTTNQYALPMWLGQYDVWGTFPHMHTLGRELRVESDHASATQCLADVPRWDFQWQQGYFYENGPLAVSGGDTLRISCTHDTSSRMTTTTWGEGTEDEMCLAFLYVSQH
jgi:hypothetical protein